MGVAPGRDERVEERAESEVVHEPPDGGDRAATAAVGLHWLIRFRWLVLVGITSFLLLTPTLLGRTAPRWLAAIPAILVFSNLLALAPWLRARLAPSPVAGGLLLLDTALFTLLFAGTGGAANPFTIFYLVEIVFSALVLRPVWTWIVAVESVLGFSLLFVPWSVTDPHAGHMGDGAGSFSSHLRGMWLAFVVAALATALFVTLLRRARDRRARELEELRDLAARYERLATLSTFAAGAAHELATPLGSIALLAAEVGGRVPAEESQERARLLGTLRQEVARCRAILDDLAGRAGETAGEPVRVVAVDALLGAALDRMSGVERERVRISAPSEAGAVRLPERAMVRSLVSLLRNAFDASPAGASVELRIERREDEVGFLVLDRGAGPRAGLAERVGEPFLTTKPRGEGLGLGLFATRQLATLLGGSFRLSEREGGGAVAEIRIPAAGGGERGTT